MNMSMQEIQPEAITDNAVKTIPFYHDFMIFLNRLHERPIKKTLTGAISLTDIASLLPQFQTTEHVIKEYNEYGWKIQSEQHLQTLTHIKIIANVMFLTYNRKGFLHLSKNGKGFLKNLSPVQQYEQIALHFWYRVNWEYFSPEQDIDGITLSAILQKNQYILWQSLLHKGNEWIDYHTFCDALCDYFHLEQFVDTTYHKGNEDLYFIISLIFFKRNLLLFNCVEIEEEVGEHAWQINITRFRVTPFGLHLFYKALHENYL